MSELVGAVLTRPIDRRRTQAARDPRASGGGSTATCAPLPSERDRNFAVARRRRRPVRPEDLERVRGSGRSSSSSTRRWRRLVAAGVPCQLPRPDARRRRRSSRSTPDAAAPLLARRPDVAARPAAGDGPAGRPIARALLGDLGRVMGRTARRARRLRPSGGPSPVPVGGRAGPRGDRRPRRRRGRPRPGGAARAPGSAASRPLATALPGLRHGVIHNDANDHNVLVDDDGDVDQRPARPRRRGLVRHRQRAGRRGRLRRARRGRPARRRSRPSGAASRRRCRSRDAGARGPRRARRPAAARRASP